MEYSKDVSNCKGLRGLGWETVRSVSPDVSSLCSQVLGHPVSEQLLPDVSLIGEFSDPAELGKLLQLVLGCAISCEKKQGMRRARGEEARELPEDTWGDVLPSPIHPCIQPLTSAFILRVYPENYDTGGICSTCSDGSHPGGG